VVTYPGDPLADAKGLPAWLSPEKLDALEERSSTYLNGILTLEDKRTVSQRIREMADSRLIEQRSLAARSLILIDEFEPFIFALKDEDQRSNWPRLLVSIQAALARGPESAKKISDALSTLEEGNRLYRMLWGYSKADIQAGAAQELVEGLDHTNMDVRVLSFYSLKAIPGVTATYLYQPNHTAAERRQSVRQWREALKSGPLSPKGALDPGGVAPAGAAARLPRVEAPRTEAAPAASASAPAGPVTVDTIPPLD